MDAKESKEPTAEELAAGLSEKHLAFCEEFLLCWNQTEAYCRIYPNSSRESAMRSASDLLRIPEVKAYIQIRLKDKVMGANEVLARLSDQARASIQSFLQIGEDGFAYFDFSDPEALSKMHAIKKVKSKRSRRVDGKGEDAEVWEDESVEVELHDAQKALELLGKDHTLSTAIVDVTSGGAKLQQPTVIEIVKTYDRPPHE